MTSVTTPGSVTDTFIYNGLGLRVGKTDSSGSYSYFCDGASPGSPVLSDGHAVYTPGLSESRGGVSSYAASDVLGNLWFLDNSATAQTYYQDTSAFGGLSAVGGTTASPFKYGGANGCQTDADTGLVLMGYRYYDTRLGRFITQDPAGDGDNWYAYADNDPIDGVDPTGLYQTPEQQTADAWNAFVSGDYSGQKLSFDSWGGVEFTGADGTINHFITPSSNSSQDIAIAMSPQSDGPGNSGPSMMQDIGAGALVGGSAVGSAASFHLWDGGAAKNDPSFGTSRGLADVGVAAATAAFGGEGAEAANGCFTKGTRVQAKDKLQEIQDLHAGDLVATRSLQTGQTEYRKVVRTFKHLAHETVTVEFADAKTGKVVDTVTGTPEHPFYVPGQGMTALGKLRIGTLVVTRAGPPVVVHSLVRHHLAAGVAVYNIEVEGDHTYFVGDNGEWVHNVCGFDAISDIKSMTNFLKGNFLKKSKSFADGRQIRDVGRLVDEYGGSAKDWSKMKNFIMHPEPGKFSQIELHWYQNMKTGLQVEFKSKL